MRYGIRKPSIRRSFKARTTGRLKRRLKSSINPLYGKKGVGYLKNPKKAVYNKIYNKTTIGVNDIMKSSVRRRKSTSSKKTAINNDKVYNKTTSEVNDIVKDTVLNDDTIELINTAAKKINTANNNKTYKSRNQDKAIKYKIINQDKVIVNKKAYTKKQVKNDRIGYFFTSILCVFAGFLVLPIGIIFMILGLACLSIANEYKNIYNKMEDMEKKNEIQAIYKKYAKDALKDCDSMSI